MTGRVPCPPAPGPLEGYAARFDDLFGSLAQRRGFREYLAGLLAPRDRNKTLTCLAGAEPVTGGAASGGAAAAVLLVRIAVGPGAGQCPQVRAAGGGPGDCAARRRGAGDRRQRGP